MDRLTVCVILELPSCSLSFSVNKKRAFLMPPILFPNLPKKSKNRNPYKFRVKMVNNLLLPTTAEYRER